MLKGFKGKKLAEELKTPKALPMGVTEFHSWAEHIIAQAGIPIMEGASTESQKFILADLLINLPSTEDFKEDLYFIKTLRKKAITQVAIHLREEIRSGVKSRLEAEARAQKEKEANEALAKQYVDAACEPKEQAIL